MLAVLLAVTTASLALPAADPTTMVRWCTERRRLVVEVCVALPVAAIVCGRLVRRAWTSYRWDGRPHRRP
jgi:hypothetical protein